MRLVEVIIVRTVRLCVTVEHVLEYSSVRLRRAIAKLKNEERVLKSASGLI